MRVGMMMRDTEYRDAMIEMMSGFDKDIFIEIAGPSRVNRDSVILTDIMPAEIESKSLEKIRARTVFLSAVPPPPEDRDGEGTGEVGQKCHVVFKYSSLTAIMAELSLVYSLWSGDTGSISPSTRIIAVTGDSDHMSADRCRSLAGQILYRHGGSVLIMPLSFINDYREPAGDDDRGWFRRLMYMIDEGRSYLPDSYTFTDSYGISYLKLPAGINPLTALGPDYLTRLISSIGSHYETLILDIGTTLSDINLRLIDSADNVLFFGSGRRIEDISLYIGEKAAEKTRKIRIDDAGHEALGIDDFVSEIYGNTGKKTDDPQIQNRH